jgi:H+-translocating NAD(P) transhydrogenase subunit alpha
MTDLLYVYIFVLAAFTGYEVISRVPVILHTPLMSGSNFVHGVVLVGAMYALAHAENPVQLVLGFLAVLLGAANAAGGYVVTERMLGMFQSKKKEIPATKEASA